MFKNLAAISILLLLILSFDSGAEENSIYVQEDENGAKVLNLKMIQNHQSTHNKENNIDMKSYTPSDLHSSASAVEAVAKVANKAINKALSKKKIYRTLSSHKTNIKAPGNSNLKVEVRTLAGMASVEYGKENKTKLDVNVIQQKVALEFVKRIAKDANFFISTKLEGSNASENLGVRWDW